MMKRIILWLLVLTLFQASGCSKKENPPVTEAPKEITQELPKTKNVDEAPKEEEMEKEKKSDGYEASRVLIFDGFPTDRLELLKPERIHTVEFSVNHMEKDIAMKNTYILTYLTFAEEEEVTAYFQDTIDIIEDKYLKNTGTIEGLYASGHFFSMEDAFANKVFHHVTFTLGVAPEDVVDHNPYFQFPMTQFIDLPPGSTRAQEIFLNTIDIYNDGIYYTRHIQSYDVDLSEKEILDFYRNFTVKKENLEYDEEQTNHVFRWTQDKYRCELRIQKGGNYGADFFINVSEQKNFYDQ